VDDLHDLSADEQNDIWIEVPNLIVSLQERIRRLASILVGDEQSLGEYRIDCAINHLQRVLGDYIWTAIKCKNPDWLEKRFDSINEELNLDGLASVSRGHG
jgi:hypothetical protein